MKRLLVFILLTSRLLATDHFISTASAGANNGTSFANAWAYTAMGSISAGDTVYVDGGASGGSKTYAMAGEFTNLSGFTGGSAGNPVTYKIGQDSAHNGTAIFNRTSAGTQWAFGGNYYVLSGDAGDGLMHFKCTGYDNGCVWNGVTGVRICYVNFDNVGAGILNCNVGTGIEFDHNYGFITGTAANIAMEALAITGTGYTDNLIHHNEIHIPHDTVANGLGTDGIVATTYVSIYNNLVYSYALAGAQGNHQDGWQGSGGTYLAIYNNLFVDMQNYGIFAEGYTVSSPYTHVRIYNNIITSTVDPGSAAQGIALSGSAAYPATDMVCANNIVDHYTTGQPYTFQFNGGGQNNPSAFVNCYFYNNIAINGGPNALDLAVTAATNAAVTSGNASTYFTSWTANGGSANNYHLTSSATPLLTAGTNVSSFGITTDKDGVAYANPPSIGPYQYVAAGGTGGSGMSGKVSLSGKVIIK